ncbi:hypothetical protein JCM10908_001013 [Rhodotorula pacifica]|uniref:pantothenate kinase n=1 Tax=Rhodotorula pacifica TaxID=1495444 RepID=UPI00318089F3
MEDSQLPSPAGTQLLVDVRGAEIVSSNSEDPEVYLPHHEEMISHIAIDIGGSLAKVVYFTRAAPSSSRSPMPNGTTSSSSTPAATPATSPSDVASPIPSTSKADPTQWEPRRTPSPPQHAKPNGFLGPKSLAQEQQHARPSSSSSQSRPASSRALQSHLRRRSSTSRIPSGGRLNFIKFETSDLSSLISYLESLISSSAQANRVPLDVMKRNVKIMATGGGAHKFYEELHARLGIEVRREEEMECLVLGLSFVMEIPNEVFWYSDELIQAVSHPQQRALSAVTIPSTPGSSATPLPLPPAGFELPSPVPPVLQQPPTGRAAMLGSVAASVKSTPSHSAQSSVSSLTVPSDSSATGSAPSPSHSTSSLPTSNGAPPPPPPEDELPRPSPNPPQYSLKFDSSPSPAQFPCLLVNIGSGVSIVKIDDYGKFERISGTSLGGGTLWGLLSLLTGAKSFDDMLALADKGDNSSVDMLVGDIYGQDYQKIGLKSSTIASSFGKVFRRGEGHGDALAEEEEEQRRRSFKAEDISRSLLYAISNNIGQIAYMNAEKHNLDRIYFGGGFIRGHAATISTLSYAIRFWSKGTKRALFLRHEGYLGGIGAWLKNIGVGPAAAQTQNGTSVPGSGTATPERIPKGLALSTGEEAVLVNGDGEDENGLEGRRSRIDGVPGAVPSSIA